MTAIARVLRLLPLLALGLAAAAALAVPPAITLRPNPAPALPPPPTPTPPPPPPALRAVVSIAPLKSLALDLLPAGSTVEVLIPPGVSEHGYEIPPARLADLARADLVVSVGLGLEPALDKFLREHPRAGRREVVFAKVVEDVVAPAGGADEHNHDHAEPGHVHGPDCDHGPADPHLWLDPVLTQRLVLAVSGAADVLLRVRAPSPGAAAEWSKALDTREEALLDRLRDLDTAHARRLAACPRKTIVVAHDAWGWLAKRYGLQTVAIAGLNAGEPTPKAIADAAKAAREGKATAIFCEPQLSPAAAKRVAEATGLKLLTLDPLGQGDYFATMRRNLDALVEGLGGPKEPESPKSR